MARSRLRVLLDLSMACRGYCGIAQDVRLLFKTLSSCPDLEVTGLIYPPRKLARHHRFCSPRKSRADRVANQASFLWKLSQGDIDWHVYRSWRGIRHLPTLARTLLAGPARCDRLDVDSFQSTIWRMMFGQTLPADDMRLVSEGKFLLANVSDGMLYARGLAGRRPVRLDTSGYDFLIVQGPRPFRISPGTRQIVRYHDMIPMLEPDTMANPWVMSWHDKAIRQSRDSYFVCNSEPTRDDLVSVYPELATHSETIPYMLSDTYWPDRKWSSVRSIINARRSTATGVTPRRALRQTPRYLMCVSTLEPRKNFVGLIQAFHHATSLSHVRQQIDNLKLVIVGSPGWNYEPILTAMRPGIARGELVHLERVAPEEMRVLYTHAEAFVFPSYAEGFGFPPVEAMQCGTPVIASDIAAHRWVLGDAALYCNPYDVASISGAIERLVASPNSPQLRSELIVRARARLPRYSLEQCRDQWMDLLGRLNGKMPAASSDRAVLEGPSNWHVRAA